MRVRDLGALVLAAGTREQPVSGTRGAAMLSILTINVNQRVSVDALMAAAWGDQVPPGAASTLASHVWRLRQLLEPGRERQVSPAVLVNDTDGYRLVGGPSTVDSLLFAEGAAEVRDLLEAGHADVAVRRADATLALWRGQPYAGFADHDWAVAAVARLEELHAQLRERRIEALLAAGSLDAAICDLEPLVAAMPFRERLRALQMRALYRGGRAEEALHAFQSARQTLVEEIGIEPGPELQAVHRQILSRDPGLDQQPAVARPVRREVEVHLPSALTPLVGRDQVLTRLTGLIRDHRLVTVTGAAGCGKTRVAVEAARRAADDFGDGVWFVDLTAVADDDLVVDVVVSTIGFAASPGATPLQDLRRYLRARRILLVLDNCEHVLPSVDRIVKAILGGAEHELECSVLATSREPIGVDVETIWTLEPLALPSEGAAGVDGVAAAPAVELFLHRLAAVAPALEVDDRVLARAAEIAVAVDGLPLPIELAAARAQSHTLDDIAAQVASDPGRLSRVGGRPRDHRATVRSAIEWSHRLLDPVEQQAHRRLAVLPGAFTAGAASAVLGAGPVGTLEGTADDVDDLLARLVHRSMLASEGSPSGARTAFRQLTTVRSHARHALDEAGETRDCLENRDAWTTSLIDARPPLGTAADVRWQAAVDADYATVRATLARRLIDEPAPDRARLAHPLASFWFYRERLVEATRWVQLEHTSTRGGETTDDFVTRLWLAAILTMQRRLDLALPLVEDMAARVRQVPQDRLVDVGEGLIALAMSFYAAETHDHLVEVDRLLRAVTDRAGDENLDLVADAVGCCALLVSGRVPSAVELAMDVQTRADAVDHPLATYLSTAPLINSALLSGAPADALPWVDRCLVMHLRFGSGATGMFAETRANVAALLGDHEDAARAYATSRTATRRAAMVWPHRELTHALLEATREHLSRTAFERAWQEGEQLTPAELVRSGGTATPSVREALTPGR